jgi:hypothetical protein
MHWHGTTTGPVVTPFVGIHSSPASCLSVSVILPVASSLAACSSLRQVPLLDELNEEVNHPIHDGPQPGDPSC